MNNKVTYQNWPQIVKVTTALSNKKVLLKTPTISYVLGYLLLIGGVFGLAYALYKQYPLTVENYFANISYVLIGVANVVTGNSIKWIAMNSSWEERFANKSSVTNKVIYVVVSLIMLACLVGVIIY